MRFTAGWRAVLAFAVLGLAGRGSARDFGLTIGQHEALESKVLGERRDILVALPDRPEAGMPLLVLLDGEGNFRTVSTAVRHLTANRRLPPTVVAGVVNVPHRLRYRPSGHR